MIVYSDNSTVIEVRKDCGNLSDFIFDETEHYICRYLTEMFERGEITEICSIVWNPKNYSFDAIRHILS